MALLRWCVLAMCWIGLSGCGGAQKPPAAISTPKSTPLSPPAKNESKPTEPVTPVEALTPEAKSLPTDCNEVRGFCMPPSDFVDRLCERNNPDVAVYMMGPKLPWSHRFVRVKEAQAVNPLNGRVGEVPLTFGEEVIILRYKSGAKPGGMQVSGTERYEILRWDGSCASLEAGEFVEKVPVAQLRYVTSTWQRISEKYRETLGANSAVADAEAARKLDCKGLGLGRPPKCHKALETLNRAVAEAVRGGFELPLPETPP